jgi:hypothetical protein
MGASGGQQAQCGIVVTVGSRQPSGLPRLLRLLRLFCRGGSIYAPYVGPVVVAGGGGHPTGPAIAPVRTGRAAEVSAPR